MSIIYVLIPIAVLLTAIGLYLFFWAVKTEQFDDLEKQGLSILFDDDEKNTSAQGASEISVNKQSTDNLSSDKPSDSDTTSAAANSSTKNN